MELRVPATMRYVAVDEPGPPDRMRVAEGPVPTPKPHEILVEVAYAGVNRPDVASSAPGAIRRRPMRRRVLGLEIVGSRRSARRRGDDMARRR